MQPPILTKKKLAVLCLLAVGAVSGTAYALKHQTKNPAAVATVDNTPVPATMVMQLVRGGMEPSVATNEAINQVVFANAAQAEFAEEANAQLEAAKVQILSQLYITKKIIPSVTDADIQKYYDNEVKDSQFTEYKVKYHLTQNQDEAQAMVSSGDDSKMAWLNPKGEHYLQQAAIPFNAGINIKDAKAGAMVGPFPTTAGYLVLKVEDSKAKKKPDIAQLKQGIWQQIVNDRIVQAKDERRKAADIRVF